MPSPLLLTALLFALPAHAVTIDWLTVSDPGNPADTEVMTTDGTTGYGSVGKVYKIAKYEVTIAHYAECLNAVAAETDTYGLYHVGMADDELITRTGSPGNYTYSTFPGHEYRPMVAVKFWDTLRFTNWLHNGQPAGVQDNRPRRTERTL